MSGVLVLCCLQALSSQMLQGYFFPGKASPATCYANKNSSSKQIDGVATGVAGYLKKEYDIYLFSFI